LLLRCAVRLYDTRSSLSYIQAGIPVNFVMSCDVSTEVSLNAYKHLTVVAVRWPAPLILVAVLAMTGCGRGNNDPPSVEALQAIENVAKWYQLYRSDNGGKQPADESAFLAFINSKLTERGQETVDRKELLTSPRDGEPYVIRYGKVSSRDQENNLVAYEKIGANGTKLIVSELARSREVDESELQSLLSRN
jgi:hypothetical protein